MTKNKARPGINILLDISPWLVLFCTLFIYFGFFGDYVSYYQEKTTFFVLSSDYLSGYTNQPGSLLIYFGNFLTALFHIPFAGAFIISAVISLMVFALSKIMNHLSGTGSGFIPFFCGISLFYIQTDYHFPLYNSIGLLLQILFFYLATRYIKGWFIVPLFLVWYLITGGFAWVFLIMFSVSALKSSARRKWPEIITMWITLLASVFILKEFFLFQPLRTLLFFPLFEADSDTKSKIFPLLAGLVCILPLLSGLKIRLFKHIKVPGIVIKLSLPLLLLASLITISVLQYDVRTREYFKADKLFFQENYNELIEFNRKNPSNNVLTNYLDNIALCETGILNDQLFQFRQDPGGKTLFLKWEMSVEILRLGGYFYYTIGMINEAQRWAYENMVIKGLTPDDLRMLVRTEILNGNYDVAAKYISVMNKTLFYRKEALAYKKLLSDEAVDSDPVYGVRRREKIQHDFFSITEDPYINIERILSRDSLNRKAYEYKLAFMLLKKNYLLIEAELQNLPKLGYKKIPLHIEEAAVAYQALNLGPLPARGTLQINPETPQRFSQFLQTFQMYGNNLKSAEPALRQKFGNTFWYWAFYR